MSNPHIGPIIRAAHSPSTTWRLHVLVPWAELNNVTSPLPDAQHDHLSDGTEIVSEWGVKALETLKSALEPLKAEQVVFHRIFLGKEDEVLDRIPAEDDNVVVLNLVDGGESDGWPGATAIRGIEKRGLAYTGSCAWFFNLDTSKIAMKQHLSDSGAPTPAFIDLTEKLSPEREKVTLQELSHLPYPLLVKPSPSSSSRGMSNKNVCNTPEEVLAVAREVKDMGFPGVYAEEFITGREFTALVSGDCAVGIRTYSAIERVFRKDVPQNQAFLSYDMKWDQYGSSKGNWWYDLAPEEDQFSLQDAARETMTKINGNGYARMDIRQDSRTKKHYVVDVNANCSIDYDPESAMALILRGSDMTFTDFLEDLIRYGLERRAAELRSHTSKIVHGFGMLTEDSNFVSPLMRPLGHEGWKAIAV